MILVDAPVDMITCRTFMTAVLLVRGIYLFLRLYFADELRFLKR